MRAQDEKLGRRPESIVEVVVMVGRSSVSEVLCRLRLDALAVSCLFSSTVLGIAKSASLVSVLTLFGLALEVAGLSKVSSFRDEVVSASLDWVEGDPEVFG